MMSSDEFDAISALIDNGRFDAAIARAESHARKGDGTGHALVARALLQAERFDECRARLPQAMRAAPELDWLHRFESALLRREKRFAEALASVHHAQRLAPESPHNYLFEAHILFDLGRTHDAIAALEDGLSVDIRRTLRGDLEAQLGRGYHLLGRWIDAEKHLRHSIEAGNPAPWQYLMLAEALEARGQTAHAFVAHALSQRARGAARSLAGSTRAAMLTAAAGASLFTVVAIMARVKGATTFALVMLALGFVAALLAWARAIRLQPSLDEVDDQLMRWWNAQRA